MKSETTSNDVACVVSADTSSIELKELYSLNQSHGGQNILRATRNWLPVVRRAIIPYFSGRPEEMFRMSSRGFEKLVAELLGNEGFKVTLTPETRDGGYDILAVRHERIAGDEVFLVECKRYARNRKINVGLIRGLIGVVQLGNATKGILVTTSQLTGPAKTLVMSNSPRLVAHDYGSLVEWLNETFNTKS
jgi:restriction system protein